MDNLGYFAFECLVILLISMFASAEFSNCVDEYCFTYPGADVTRSFDGAKSWCANNNSSTLAVVSNESSHDALTKFLLSSNISSTLYLNAKLNTINDPTWFFVNGTRFTGLVENQDNKEETYKFYTSLQTGTAPFVLFASSPQEQKSYICKYTGGSGLNISPNTSYSNGDSMYVKYENDTLSWFEARNRCYLKGGDLATFSDLSNFNTSWLNSSSSYWIGIRWNNRCWKTTVDGPEIICTRWSTGKPNNSSAECVCIDRSSSWNWTDCDCSTERSFVCSKYRGISSTASATTTISSTTSFQKEPSSNRTPEYSNINSSDNNFQLAVGLGVGLGVGIPLAIFVVVVVVIVFKKRNGKQGTTERPNKTKGEGEPYHEPTKPQAPEVVKQTDNFAVYADIVPLAQPIVKEPTKTPIVYSNPEFVGTMTS